MHDGGDATLRAYEEAADAYLAAQRPPSPDLVAWIERFAALLPAGALVLELGSGPGTDALRLAALGLRVLRSEATRAFAARLRALGHDVLDLDVRRSGLPAGIDAVFADAVLLHLTPEELLAALRRLHGALPAGGVLACTLKEGDGTAWTTAKLGLPRRFTFWRADALRGKLETAGFAVLSIERSRGAADDWLQVLARA